MRRSGRRQRQETVELPDLPVEPGEGRDAVVVSEKDVEAMIAPARSRRPVLPRRLPFVIHWPTLLVIVGLIALTVILLLLNQGALPVEVSTGWPIVVIALAILWFLAALIRRDPRSLIGSAALFGCGLSLLLSVQRIAPFGATLVGVTFIAAGTGIMLRGLLLRNQPIG
ncbi:MAG: hypothetical protein ABI947_08255 [Chloroflexota bacterium]